MPHKHTDTLPTLNTKHHIKRTSGNDPEHRSTHTHTHTYKNMLRKQHNTNIMFATSSHPNTPRENQPIQHTPNSRTPTNIHKPTNINEILITTRTNKTNKQDNKQPNK